MEIKKGNTVRFRAESLLGPTTGEGKVVAIDKMNNRLKIRYWMLIIPQYIWIRTDDVIGVW